MWQRRHISSRSRWTKRSALVAEHPGSLVIAGGTLALPLINKGVSQPEKVIGLRRAGLGYVRHENGAVQIGATTTLTQVRSAAGIPLLVEAAGNVGGWAVQNMGTAGGNLFAPPPAGDLAVALLALDAQRQARQHTPRRAHRAPGRVLHRLHGQLPRTRRTGGRDPGARFPRARPCCSSTAGSSPTRRRS